MALNLARLQQNQMRLGSWRAPQRRLVGGQLHPQHQQSVVRVNPTPRTPPQVPQALSSGLNSASSSGTSNATSNADTSNKQAKPSSSSSKPGSAGSWLQAHASIARKLLSSADAGEAGDLLAAEIGASSSLKEEECAELLAAALEKGNTALALSIHSAMRAARRPQTSLSSLDAGFVWPAATIQATCALVLGLCKQIAISEAVRIIGEIRVQGLPRSEEVGFGKVISSPLAPGRTLTVVQPQEGFKLVADAYSKYEYEVFSGKVVTCSSEALQSQAGNPLVIIARALKLQRMGPPAAVHTMTAQAPDGTSRTFRFATETANVPAQVGERVTVVCAPFKSSNKRRRAIFAATPPGRKPGEAMQATNHKTGAVMPLLTPPLGGSQGGIPSWVVPAVLLLGGGDAASQFIDPALPAMIAAGSVAALGSVLMSTTVIVPKLKQLSDRDVSLEYVRQQLLGQYALIAGKSADITAEANEDIRVLARLWQLQSKMESVGQTATAYEGRISRISLARQNIEARLSKKLELLDGYARVMNMIEIEVEMDMEVPAAELEGIEQQLVRLEELEGLQDDWRVQAEARDEVEKLLKAAPS